MRFTRSFVFLAAALAAFSASASAQKPITLADAETMAHEAMNACRVHGYKVSVVVLDAFQMEKVLLHDDGAAPSNAITCKIKAYSAIMFDRPSGDHIPPGATKFSNVVTPGTTRDKGGVPIKIGDVTIGAIGVSGAPGDWDGVCAKIGLAKVAEKLGAHVYPVTLPAEKETNKDEKGSSKE
jgi:uncharacterized protein GlcG (DUF336 family)